MKSCKNEEQLQQFLEYHGAKVIDRLGSEVDRIEKKLKVTVSLTLFHIKKPSLKIHNSLESIQIIFLEEIPRFATCRPGSLVIPYEFNIPLYFTLFHLLYNGIFFQTIKNSISFKPQFSVLL